jgi:hypothetical protein
MVVLQLIMCHTDDRGKVTRILKSRNFHVIVKCVYYISVCSLIIISVNVFICSAELLNEVVPFMMCTCQTYELISVS